MRTITRTTNPNGTYRYEIDGDVIYKASKVLYTHASTYSVGTGNDPVLFHKTKSAANKATGYRNNGWVKTGVQAIVDADPMPTADELTWHEILGQSRAFDPRGNCVIEMTVDGRNQWCWAISRREILASGRGIVDLETAKSQALAALATL